MRIYKSFPEAKNEIARDLNELGLDVHTDTYQDKFIGDKPEFATKELPNYLYMVLDPDFTQVEGIHSEWVEQEWQDRLIGSLNPGNAWKTRPEVWEQFLEKDERGHNRFSYTYSERMGGKHIQHIIEELKRHSQSRQLYLSVWKQNTDEERLGNRRVPCSLGYHFLYRQEKLHITYSMRSCDFVTHYPNDICLAAILLHHVAEKAKLEVGTFTHFVGSLHVFAKDVEGVF